MEEGNTPRVGMATAVLLSVLLVGIAAVLGSTGGCGKAVAPAGQAPAVYLGAWVGERVNVPGEVDRFEEAIGKRLAIVHRYSDNPPYRGQRFDVEWADAVRSAGSIPMLSWQPGFGYGTRSLGQVARGERDDYLTLWADQLREWGHPVFLRMMWEQNSPWFGWQAYREPQISEFVAAWRHIVDLFRTRGANNVTLVWSPHVSGSGASEIMPTYPGDSYVDWVALDGYPYRGGRGDFADTFGPDYDLLSSQVSKPIMIAETSLESWNDEQKASWISDILSNQLPNRFPKVKALVWFEEKDTDGIHYSILEEKGPLSRAAFRDSVSTHYYASNHYGDLSVSPIPPPDSARLPSIAHGSEGGPTEGGPAAPVSPTTANLLVDPGFESAGPEGGLDPAWVVPTWVLTVVSRNGEAAASGLHSMLHASERGESYTVYQEVPAEAGEEYDISVALRIDAALRHGKANLDIHFLNRHGGVVGAKPVATWKEGEGDWTRISGKVRAPGGTARARVQIRVTSLRGAFRLDDFSFSRSQR